MGDDWNGCIGCGRLCDWHPSHKCTDCRAEDKIKGKLDRYRFLLHKAVPFVTDKELRYQIDVELGHFPTWENK